MISFMVGNQKGGVAKTTSAVNLSRCFADRGFRTLLVDSDPQGSIEVLLALDPNCYLSDFILQKLRLEDCVLQIAERLDVLCGGRETATMEQKMVGEWGREHIFEKAFAPYATAYDVMIFDVGPSITLAQACSMVLCKNLVIPVSIDTLSVAAAGATISAAESIGANVNVPIRPMALLPTNVDKRYSLTDVVIKMMHGLSQRYSIPTLDPIRTDSAVGKAAREHKMLADLDRKAKALADYEATATSLLSLFGIEPAKAEHGEAVAV
jgi:chromosome partitioning protein